jgi:hypothetical protein
MIAVELGRGPSDIETLRHEVATGCRIAGHRGLCEDILGHISVRAGDGLLIRCRGPRESGLLFTQLEDVRLASYERRGPRAGRRSALPLRRGTWRT